MFPHGILAIAFLIAIMPLPSFAAWQNPAPPNPPAGASDNSAPRAPEDIRPLPDIPALLRDINKNQRALEELRKLYTCHLSETEDNLDSHGEVKSTAVKEYDVFYVGDDEVRRLLAKDGKPLGPAQQKKEEARFNKEFDQLKKKQAELDNDPKKRAKQEEKDDAELSDFLRAERFTNPRREQYRGKDVIAFDFSANPDYKPKKMVDRIIQKISGVMRVDEDAREIVQLEAQFDSSAKVGAGLLGSVHKGSAFVFEQERINDEVWLPIYIEVHIDARLLVVNFRRNAVDRYSGYKKFRVGATLGESSPVPHQPSGQSSPSPTSPN